MLLNPGIGRRRAVLTFVLLFGIVSHRVYLHLDVGLIGNSRPGNYLQFVLYVCS